MVISDPTCFGTKVPSTWSLLKQGNTIQHVNPGTDRPHCRHQNTQYNIQCTTLSDTMHLTRSNRAMPFCITLIETDVCIHATDKT